MILILQKLLRLDVSAVQGQVQQNQVRWKQFQFLPYRQEIWSQKKVNSEVERIKIILALQNSFCIATS
jgi:hypothetical protein